MRGPAIAVDGILGRAYAGHKVPLLVVDLDARVLSGQGELLGHVVIDRAKDYQSCQQELWGPHSPFQAVPVDIARGTCANGKTSVPLARRSEDSSGGRARAKHLG